jgi:hypothetical protein
MRMIGYLKSNILRSVWFETRVRSNRTLPTRCVCMCFTGLLGLRLDDGQAPSVNINTERRG